jgi:hypothetical protein
VTDRGDEFYETFAEHHRARLDEQAAGVGVFFALVDRDASVVGRFNLYDLENGAATGRRTSGVGSQTRAYRLGLGRTWNLDNPFPEELTAPAPTVQELARRGRPEADDVVGV